MSVTSKILTAFTFFLQPNKKLAMPGQKRCRYVADKTKAAPRPGCFVRIFMRLYVETDFYHVSVFYEIFLALKAKHAGFSAFVEGISVQSEIVE